MQHLIHRVLRFFVLTLAAGLFAACSAPSANPAVNTPDQFAWQRFMEVSRPIPGDPQGHVAWEGWALAREVFADPNATPDWDTLVAAPRTLEHFDPMPLQQMAAHPEDAPVAAFDPALSPFGVNETRMNRATFDFIVANNLWYIEGQEALFASGHPIVFPVEAMEVKAQWRPVTPDQAPLYHTTTLTTADGQVHIFGLTALHITTKDLPNWFWATWEHKSNPDRETVIPSRDRAGLPVQLKGTVWENYVLRGSQIDFVDSTGRPTILANSQIEEGFEATSSCITCHARATIGKRDPTLGGAADRLDIFASVAPLLGSTGAPNPDWFYTLSNGTVTPKYAQTDFVWSLLRAGRRTP